MTTPIYHDAKGKEITVGARVRVIDKRLARFGRISVVASLSGGMWPVRTNYPNREQHGRYDSHEIEVCDE